MGPRGPYAEKKAYDLLVQCEAGLLSVTGTPDSPAKAGIPVADIAAGMYALTSILAALLRRARDGEGATLDITMFEALGEWMGFPAYFSAYGGTPPPRSGAYHATIVPYGPFRAGDGKNGVSQHPERARVRALLRQGAGELCARKGLQVLVEPREAAEPRGDARRDRKGVRQAHRGAGGRAPGARRDRQRAPEHHAGILGAPATRRARALGAGRYAGRPDPGDEAAVQPVGFRAAHGGRARTGRRTAGEFLRNWATPRRTSRGAPGVAGKAGKTPSARLPRVGPTVSAKYWATLCFTTWLRVSPVCAQ